MRPSNSKSPGLWPRVAAIAVAATIAGCAVVPLDHHGEPVAVSPAEAVFSTAVVTFGVLHFLGAFSHRHHGPRHHWRGRGRGHHRGGWGRAPRRHRY